MGKNRFLTGKIKLLDFVFILLVTAVTLVFFLRLSKKSNSRQKVLVAKSTQEEYVFPLDRDGEYKVLGLYGNSVIEVIGGKARFKDSPCPNKTCVQHGFISSPGEWAACLPNDVFILVEGSKKDSSIDAVAD